MAKSPIPDGTEVTLTEPNCVKNFEFHHGISPRQWSELRRLLHRQIDLVIAQFMLEGELGLVAEQDQNKELK